MTVRRVLLNFHLSLGLAAALFLVILGLTGSVMAFETEIPHWLHPELFYVSAVAPHRLPEQELIRMVEERFAPARVRSEQFLRGANLARVIQLSGGLTVTISPYDGSALGSWKGLLASDRILGYIHQIHLRLTPDPRSMPNWSAIGKYLIGWAGVLLCLLVPTGLILFWRTRRMTIKTSATWARICFDTHHVLGVFSALFLMTAAFTGVMIGFDWGEKTIYAVTQSKPPARMPPVESLVTAGTARITADDAIAVARKAIDGTTVAGVVLPTDPKAAYMVLLRVPEDTSETVHSRVLLDQYSGRVLQVNNFLTDSQGYRVIRFNRSIHTGDVLGTPTHIIMSVSSLLLVAMVVTGLAIWWRKLAV